jgi:hypothetical protein
MKRPPIDTACRFEISSKQAVPFAKRLDHDFQMVAGA